MRRLLAWGVITVAPTATLLAVSCSSDPAPSPDFTTTEAGTRRDSGRDGTSLGETSTPDPDGSTTTPQVFAHTPTSLYRFDPISKNLTKIGNFDCLGDAGEEMYDIALDQSGAMYGTTSQAFVTINPVNAKCNTIKRSPDYPDSLGFVPTGTADPVREALVGYSFGDYVRIDTVTGELSKIGSLNAPDAGSNFYSSGDVVAIIGDRAYLTAYTFALDAGPGDYLLEINPTTGRMIRVVGSVGKPQLWGTAYWAGVTYAFSNGGEVLQLNPSNASPTRVAALDGGPDAKGFYGAGVTTSAPTK